MTLPFQIVPFSREYDRTSFCSSSVQLNQYLQKQVSQDIKRKLASCYLMVTPDKQIVGFYTLSSYVVEFCELSAKHQKKLPRYPFIPAVLLGRLAVDSRFLGQKIGKLLLLDALNRANQSQIASAMLVVEAKDDNAIAFYRHFGFLSFGSVSDKLYYPLT